MVSRGDERMADIPQIRRGVRFTESENRRLVEEVRTRKIVIYGKGERAPQPIEVRLAWEEVAEVISTVSGIERSSDQCRKRFNDMKRRGIVVTQPCVETTLHVNLQEDEPPPTKKKRGRPPKKRLGESDVESRNHLEPVDLEFEVDAPMDDDPDYEPSPVKPEMMPSPKVLKKPATSSLSSASARPKEASFMGFKQEDKQGEKHPFLELQKGGFEMLQRELHGFQTCIKTLERRMSQVEVLLQPIGDIADSLSRIAESVERLTCPPSP
ncbi:unnamed protein product [Knipowitschia caucasica]